MELLYNAYIVHPFINMAKLIMFYMISIQILFYFKASNYETGVSICFSCRNKEFNLTALSRTMNTLHIDIDHAIRENKQN